MVVLPTRGPFQVLLGEVNTGLNTTQVVVKELKSSAGVQDQMHFLEEAQPYRYVNLCHTLNCMNIDIIINILLRLS